MKIHVVKVDNPHGVLPVSEHKLYLATDVTKNLFVTVSENIEYSFHSNQTRMQFIHSSKKKINNNIRDICSISDNSVSYANAIPPNSITVIDEYIDHSYEERLHLIQLIKVFLKHEKYKIFIIDKIVVSIVDDSITTQVYCKVGNDTVNDAIYSIDELYKTLSGRLEPCVYGETGRVNDLNRYYYTYSAGSMLLRMLEPPFETDKDVLRYDSITLSSSKYLFDDYQHTHTELVNLHELVNTYELLRSGKLEGYMYYGIGNKVDIELDGYISTDSECYIKNDQVYALLLLSGFDGKVVTLPDKLEKLSRYIGYDLY